MSNTFLFHPEHAPKGKRFDAADEERLFADGWVDTPAKFDDEETQKAIKAAAKERDKRNAAASANTPASDDEGGDESKHGPSKTSEKPAQTGGADAPENSDLESMTGAARYDAIEAMDKDALHRELAAREVSVHPNTGEDKLRAALHGFFQE